MFSNQKKINIMPDKDNSIDTLIGELSNFEGNIKSEGILKIDGSLTGDINSSSNVIVGESGYIKGNIVALNISISGKVEGNINCSGLLELLPNCELIGDVNVTNILVENGAVFIGKCSMNKNVPNPHMIIDSKED